MCLLNTLKGPEKMIHAISSPWGLKMAIGHVQPTPLKWPLGSIYLDTFSTSDASLSNSCGVFKGKRDKNDLQSNMGA